jgi:hypothetical protein
MPPMVVGLKTRPAWGADLGSRSRPICSVFAANVSPCWLSHRTNPKLLVATTVAFDEHLTALPLVFRSLCLDLPYTLAELMHELFASLKLYNPLTMDVTIVRLSHRVGS